jgi:anaerobic magnesium-protoporphyrin IX monomethyl ester cyclase
MARVAFIQNLYEDQLGILWISSVLNARGHQSRISIVSSKRQLERELAEFRPQVVGLSCTTGNISFALNCARKIKSLARSLIVVGGPHPTHMPEIIEHYAVDIVCRGEGEHAMEELADAIDAGSDFSGISNLWVKRNGAIHKNKLRPLIPDLDSLSFPDRSYYERYPLLKEKTTKLFICSRGCPFNCSFCSNPALKRLYRSQGKFVRFRSPGNVIEEIQRVKAASPLHYCQFVDELMISDKQWLFHFLELYRKKIALPFSICIQARIADEETIKELRSAGCYLVSFGLETGNEKLRKTVLRKDVSNSDIINTAALVKKYGIRIKTFNMFGIPGETVENSFETLRLNRRIKSDYSLATLVQFFPGTELSLYALEKGLIDSDYVSKAPKTIFKSSICKMPHIREIMRFQKLFSALVILPIPEPVIKVMLKLPLDLFYELVFILTYGIMVVRSTQKRFLNTLLIALKLMRFIKK